MTRAAHVLEIAALNAIPLVGWFGGDWSGGTTLAVYWFENVAVALFIWARLAVHRRRSPRRGHFRYQAAGTDRRDARTSFVGGYLTTSVAFCAGHGIFLAAILLILSHNGRDEIAAVDWRAVGLGCAGVLVVLVIDFALDLVHLPNWSFAEIEQLANRGIGRIVVVHLTLILGLVAVAVTDAPTALFGVFLVLRALHAVSSALPQWEPTTAPSWLSSLMNRLPNAHPGRSFEEFWATDRAAELARRTRNEEPWP